MIKVEYDKPIEVTKEQCDFFAREFAGIIVHRHDERTNRYLIKVWIMPYAKIIERILNQK